jgi:hypothetical protein
LYANSAEDAVSLLATIDAEGHALNGGHADNVLVLSAPPPVKRRWRLTIHEIEPWAALDVDLDLRRQTIGQRPEMLRRGEDGSLSIYIQRKTPGAEREANWLMAPARPFALVLKAFGPEPAFLSARWVVPPVVRVG